MCIRDRPGIAGPYRQAAGQHLWPGHRSGLWKYLLLQQMRYSWLRKRERMKFITGFFMAWGNFITLPCPYKKWDGQLKNMMLSFLPSVGLVIGVLWMAIFWLMVYLQLPPVPVSYTHLDVYKRQRFNSSFKQAALRLGLCQLILRFCWWRCLERYPCLLYTSSWQIIREPI